MPAADLRARLQRLRLQKLKRDIPPPVPSTAPRPRRATPGVLPGERVESNLGAFQLIQTNYELDYQHGPKRLADLLGHQASTAARLARDEKLAGADLRGLAFIDTETTGLAGGAGTLVFLVGVGVWDGDRFALRQYFLLDPGDEAALLTALVADLAPRVGWVSFNGRAFDLPLLETRLTINRQRGALGQRPHLDLLMPARRLYRGRLPTCSLGDIERGVFELQRDQDDVPGFMIPGMYLDYLRTGNPDDMRRVIYHNTVDILSMVTLASHLMDVFATPLSAGDTAGRKKTSATPGRNPADLLRLGCWHADNGRPDEAEVAFKEALAGKLKLEERRLALTRLAALLKRLGRRGEAAPLWEQLASFTLDDPDPFVELAMYHEWQTRDLAQALTWTERARGVVAGWPSSWQTELAATELRRRQERLQAKQQAAGRRASPA
jgi:uncharacterized protein YprB with RNaseH-like and TPR domain